MKIVEYDFNSVKWVFLLERRPSCSILFLAFYSVFCWGCNDVYSICGEREKKPDNKGKETTW